MTARGHAWTAIALLGGCVIDASIEGKGCPCAAGYLCNPADECVRKTCEPGVIVSSFAPKWATSHAIRWTWAPGASEERFLRYEVWVAESKQDLATRTGTARRFGPEENPELGGYRLRVATDPVASTITRGLDADTPYFAQLVAVDVAGCEFGSQTMQRRTAYEPQSAITLFEDELLPGAVPSPGALRVEDDLDGGGSHLEYRAPRDDGCAPEDGSFEEQNATCGQPLSVRGLSLDVSDNPMQNLARLDPGTFVNAYLEMRVVLDAVVPSFYSSVWLTTGDTCPPDTDPAGFVFKFVDFTIPNGATELNLEVPLTALAELDAPTARPFTYDEIDTAGAGMPLCSFALQGTWHKLGIVYIDDVKIRF